MKKMFFSILVLFIAFSITSANIAEGAETKKMAGSGGLGFTFPMGETGDMVNFPMIPLLLSFQYAVMPFLTVEADVDYYIYTNTEDPVSDYKVYQYGVSARYWLTTKFKSGKAYDGIYAGGGLARTNVEVESEYRVVTGYNPISGEYTYETRTASGDDTYTTFVLKGGYIYPLNPVILDFGARYDAVDFEFGDAMFTVYAMASYLF